MSRLETYCEAKYIKTFCHEYPSNPTDENHKLWIEIFELLHRKSELLIDSKHELINASTNPLIKHIIKASTSGGSDIYELADHFEQINNDISYIKNTNNKSPIYLLNKEIPEEIRNYGLFVANNKDQYKKFAELKLLPRSIKVNRLKPDNEFKSWQDFFRSNLPLNSLVIADNYLLDKQENFQNNIYQILESLLPSNSTEELHVAIITKRDLLNPEKKYTQLIEFIRGLNIEKFQLGIYLTSTDKPHDRMIISNYFTLVSGHSLNFINTKNDITKDTSLYYFPIFEANNIHSHIKDLTVLSKYTKNCKLIGDGENRLLDYYK